MPTSAQHASRRFAAPRSTPEPEQHARTVSTPSLRISGVKNRLSECQTITRKNPAKRHSRDKQIMSGRHSRHVLESAFFNRTDRLVLPQSNQKAAAQHSRSAAFSVSPRQYGPNHAKPCTTHHEAGHQDGHFLALTHVESASKRLKRTCHQRERRQQNGQQQAQE